MTATPCRPTRSSAPASCFLFAGHETTTNLIGNGFPLFRCAKTAANGKRLVADSVARRFRRSRNTCATTGRPAPSPGVAAADIEMRGKTIREGQRVFRLHELGQPRSRRDRRPRALRHRPPRRNPHLTFGHGIHFCLGAPAGPARNRANRRPAPGPSALPQGPASPAANPSGTISLIPARREEPGRSRYSRRHESHDLPPNGGGPRRPAPRRCRAAAAQGPARLRIKVHCRGRLASPLPW